MQKVSKNWKKIVKTINKKKSKEAHEKLHIK